MLIFVQVYRTIDKILRPFIGSEWTKESKEIEQKGSLKVSEEELLLKLVVLLKT